MGWIREVYLQTKSIAKNKGKLIVTLQEEWEQIPKNVYINLIKSMSKRVQACIAVEGWPTKY